MPTSFRKLSSSLEVGKNLAQIVGILGAGAWAVFVFTAKECPSLERRLDVYTDVSWSQVSNRCVANVTFGIDNKGTLPVDVTDVTLTAYKFPASAFAGASPILIDRALIKRIGTKLTSLPTWSNDDKCPLVGRYPIGRNFNYTYQWSFDQSDSEQWVYYSETVSTSKTKDVLTGETWSQISCVKAAGQDSPKQK